MKLEKLIMQSDLCDGCLDCEGACCGIYGTSRINIREVESSYYSIVCQQCEDAPCKTICPTEAMIGKGVLEEKCIACGLCMMVCPFGAVTIENKKAQKCDQCSTRDEEPACVKACSKRALSLINYDELKLKKQKLHLSKLAGIEKSKKETNFVNILTSSSRANKRYNE